MKKAFSILILTTMLCTLIVGAVWAEGMTSNLITAIEARGNKVVPTEEILSVVKTKVGQKIDNQKLQEDLQAVYNLGYFFNVQLASESHLGGVKLIIDVVENPNLQGIAIKGTKVVAESKLIELMTSKVGQMLNSQTLNKDLRAIEEYYQKQGYVLSYIEDVTAGNDGILTITLNEGYLNDIKITGNEKTKEYVIRRELHIKPGEVFNLNQVQDDLRAIYNLGLFNDVKPRFEKAGDNANKVDLVIEVEEKKTGNLQVGAAYSSKEGLLGYAEVKEDNLLGRAQKIGFKWEFGQTINYELSFFDPWAFGKQFSYGINLYNTTNKNGKETIENKVYKVTKKSKGISMQIGKPIAEDITGSLKFKYENTDKIWNDDKDAIFKEEKGDTRSLTLATVRDTTDNPFSPHTGGRDSASIEYAGQLLGGTYNFTKYNLDLSRYFPGFKESHTWAFRLKTGFGTGTLPSHEQFTLGGAETLRGYEQNSIEGDKMLLFNAEYRFPLVKSLSGVAFVDTGNAWKNADKIELASLKMGYGLGVMMDTPLGQIRLGYAFGSQNQEKRYGMPYFGIGQSF